MKRTPVFILLVGLLLSACAPAPAPTSAPSVTPLPTATPTPTPTPTRTPTPTPTPIPTIQVGGLSVPDPRFSNPELFDLEKSDAPIPQFVNAMRQAGIEVAGEEVAQGLTFQQLKDKDGNPFVVATAEITSFPQQYADLNGAYPLMIATRGENGEWGWNKASLKDVANQLRINVGTLLGGYGFADYYKDLIRVQREYFNYGMVDTDMFGAYMSPSERNYENIDSDVKLGVRNGMPMMSHLLVWPSRVPDWLVNGEYSNEQIMEMMTNWITTTMQRYPQIKVWEIVNEAYNNDFFERRFGRDYIVEFYRIARAARPDAILIYNDYANHSLEDENFPNGQRTNLTLQIVQRLKNENLIDGVGVQMVTFADKVADYEDIANTLRNYGNYDLPVYVTEFQIIMTNVNGSQETRWREQAGLYFKIVQAILNSGNCNTIIFFNQSDKVSPWENEPNLPEYSKNADPTLFDDNYHPKPAYYAVLKILYQTAINH